MGDQELLEIFLILGMAFLFHLYLRIFRPPNINAHYWAEKMLWLSWANGFISLDEVENRFSCPPKINGRLLYLVNTDDQGNILNMGAEICACEELIGYYTDGHSFAMAFLWREGLNNDPECLYVGELNPKKHWCQKLKLLGT